MRPACLVCAIGLLACVAAYGDDPVSFVHDIAPVLRDQCASCHLTGQEAGRLALHPGAAYASLVGVPSTESKLMRIKPGAPEESYMLLKVEGRHLDAGGTGARMPLGSAPLDSAILARIRAWISAGAKAD